MVKTVKKNPVFTWFQVWFILFSLLFHRRSDDNVIVIFSLHINVVIWWRVWGQDMNARSRENVVPCREEEHLAV
jgi:hypothetical protein